MTMLKQAALIALTALMVFDAIPTTMLVYAKENDEAVIASDEDDEAVVQQSEISKIKEDINATHEKTEVQEEATSEEEEDESDFSAEETVKTGVDNNNKIESYNITENAESTVTEENEDENSPMVMSVIIQDNNSKTKNNFAYDTSTQKWYYYNSDGDKATSKTGFVSGTGPEGSGDYYVKSGVIQTGKTGLVEDSGKYYYVVKGKKDVNTTGFIYGAVNNQTAYWYIKSGIVQTSATGLYSGTIKSKTGKYYVKKGAAQTSYSEFKSFDGTWYYIYKGMVASDVDGLRHGTINNVYDWYYVKNGKYTKSTGVVPLCTDTSKYYYVNKGVWDGYFNGCYNDGSNVWYLKQGTWESDVTGVYTDTSGKMWYIKNGKANKTYSGTKTYNGVTYTIKKGVATYKSQSLVSTGTSTTQKAINKELNKLPSTIIAMFAQDGGTITAKNYIGTNSYSEEWGLCTGASISIKNTKEAAEFSVIHEIGHWLNWKAANHYGEKSDSQEFKAIMNAEISNYRKAFKKSEIDGVVYNTNDSAEYFADAFKMYYLHGSTLKKNCPKTYNYIKKTINNVKNGKVSTTWLATPYLKSIKTNKSGNVVIKWGNVSYVQKYRVFRKEGSDGSWTKLTDTTSTSYTDKTAKAGKTYYYTVRCVNNTGSYYQSAYDSSGLKIKYAATPTLKSVAANNKGITIKWNSVKGVGKYRVFRKTENGSWKKLADVSSSTLSYTDTTAKTGIKYTYTVRCISTDKTTYTSGYKDGLGVKKLSTPTLKSAKASSNGNVTVKWLSVSGASKYRVFRKDSANGTWKKLADTTSTFYLDKTAKVGKTYYYTVRCVDSSGYVSGYDTKGISTNEIKSNASTASTQTYKTTANVNYRTGPGTNYKIKGVFKKGSNISIDATYSKNANGIKWYRFSKNGAWYYISSSYLKKI